MAFGVWAVYLLAVATSGPLLILIAAACVVRGVYLGRQIAFLVNIFAVIAACLLFVALVFAADYLVRDALVAAAKVVVGSVVLTHVLQGMASLPVQYLGDRLAIGVVAYQRCYMLVEERLADIRYAASLRIRRKRGLAKLHTIGIVAATAAFELDAVSSEVQRLLRTRGLAANVASWAVASRRYMPYTVGDLALAALMLSSIAAAI